MGTRGTPVSKSTSKSEAEFPNGKQPILWQRPGVKGIGRQFVVPCPRDCDNFNFMVSSTRKYRIAGKDWHILGVCGFTFHTPPYKAGQPILLECWPIRT